MSEANAKQLVTDWDAGMATSTMTTNGYEYVLDDLERLGWLTAATQVASVAETATYTLPTGAVRLLTVFYGDRELFRESRSALRYYGERWRDRSGSPIAFLEDQETDNTFRLWPTPTLASDSFTFPNGEPFGRDFPRYCIITVASHRDDPPTWLDVTAALLTLAYTREI